jgi:branched-chain amino acid transport system substrate-binding protein
MTMKWINKVSGGFIAAATAIALAACSSGSQSDSASAVSTMSFKGTIAVGAIGPYSGANSSGYSGLPKVLSAWEQTVNDNGGINGYRVNLITQDVGLNPTAGPVDAKTLIAQDHVVAIIDDTDSNDGTWLPYATSHNIPVIAGIPNDLSLVNPQDFDPFVSVPAIVAGVVQNAKATGGGLSLTENGGSQSSFATLLFTQVAKSLGVRLASHATVPATTVDFTAICQQIKNAAATALYNGVTEATLNQSLIDTCRQQGVQATTLLTGNTSIPAWKTDPAFRGSVVEDFVSPFFDTDVPGVKAYRDALQKYAPSVIGTTADNPLSLAAWASAQLLAAAAAKQAGPLTPAKVENGLYLLKGSTLDGIIPPVTFTRGAPYNSACYFSWRISSSSQFTPMNKAQPTCLPSPVITPIMTLVSNALKSSGQ